METTIKERLVEYLKYKKKGQNKFEKEAGLSIGYINKLRKEPSMTKLRGILNAAPDLNEQWLLTGEGPMLKEEKSGRGVFFDSKEVEEVLKKSIQKGFEHDSPILSMFAGIGGIKEAVPSNDVSADMEKVWENKNQGVFFEDKYGILRLSVPHVPYAARAEFANLSDKLEMDKDEWSREFYVVDKKANGNYLSFEVKGDSMDDGSRSCLQEGDKVLVRELERDNWRQPLKYENHPYWVIVFGSSVLIKQIIAEDLESGQITCHSLNPSPEYSDFTLPLDEVRNLYYVIKIKQREISLV